MSHTSRFGANLLFQFRKIRISAEEGLLEQIQKKISKNPSILKKQAKPSTKKQDKLGFIKKNYERVSLLDWNGDYEAVWDIPKAEDPTENENLSPWSKGFRKMWTVFHETGAFKYPVTQNIIWFLHENKAEPLNIAGKTSTLTKLARLFGRMQKRGGHAETAALNTFLHVICEAGEPGQADSLVRHLRCKIKPNKTSYLIIFNGLCKTRRIKRALEVLTKIAGRKCMDVVLFNKLLDAMCRENEFDMANELMEKMARNGCYPNVVTYNVLIHWFCEAKMVEMAVQVYKVMLEQGLVVPNKATYETLIKTLCEVGNAERACQVFGKMCSAGFSPCVEVYNWFIRYYCKERDIETALELLGEMKERGLHREAYGLLIRSLCMQDRLDEALVLWKEMRAERLKIGPDLYEFMIRAFCCRGELGNAFGLLHNMICQRWVPQCHTWDMFCVKCVKDAGWSVGVYLASVHCACKSRSNAGIRGIVLGLLDKAPPPVNTCNDMRCYFGLG